MRILVTVKPRARQASVTKVDDGHFKVSVTAVPEGGKANGAVVAALSDYFSVAKSNIRIVLGKTAREKLIDIAE
ncbi:hypothetical protein CL628_04580 [bacterium]|nr:hypothetical protein [bacterium]